MQVRVQAQVLSPGVKYTNGARFHSKMDVPGSPYRIPCTGEQTIIKSSTIEQAYIVQLMRERKHNMIMLHRQGRLYEFIYPERLFKTLAFGTMPVTTTIITLQDTPASITSIRVPAHSRCTA